MTQLELPLGLPPSLKELLEPVEFIVTVNRAPAPRKLAYWDTGLRIYDAQGSSLG